jgi:hypothetical protein
MTRGLRIALRVAGAACLVAGLWPEWSTASGPDGGRTDLRIGVPGSPAYWYHREEFSMENVNATASDGARIEASSLSGYRSEWHVRVFSWSIALVLAGAVLLALGLRRQPAAPQPKGGDGHGRGT